MIILHAKFKIKPDKIDEMLELAKGMIKPSNDEIGCISYEFFQDPFNNNYFIFVESWTSKKDLELHFEMPYFKNFDSKVAEIVEEKPSVVTYDISGRTTIS